jgi:hypothetical protein
MYSTQSPRQTGILISGIIFLSDSVRRRLLGVGPKRYDLDSEKKLRCEAALFGSQIDGAEVTSTVEHSGRIKQVLESGLKQVLFLSLSLP